MQVNNQVPPPPTGKASDKTSGKTKSRDSRYETLRIVAMLLVVSCHFVAHIGWNLETSGGVTQAVAYAIDQFGGQIGVCIFFIISGYFLVNKDFRVERVLRTMLQTLVYTLLFFIVAVALSSRVEGIPLSLTHLTSLVKGAYQSFLPTFNGTYWFITAYVFLQLFAPLLNAAVHNIPRRAFAQVLVLLPVLSIMAVMTLGQLLWTNLTYAITAYLFGAYIKLNGSRMRIGKRLRPWHVALFMLLSFAAIAAFYYALDMLSITRQFRYSNHHVVGTVPLLPILAVSGIFLILHNGRRRRHAPRANGPTAVQKMIGGLAKTVFGVYLIHENPFIKEPFWNLISALLPKPHSPLLMIPLGVLGVIGVYAVLLLAAFIIDTVLVHPAEKLIIPGLARRLS
ncbi:acyltransferase [Bifidobacterium simiarum]|uniref:acyltransferase n=1 Tax=Bifidobacterium simiarum TaxID=2045441 RepID=UPI001BDD5EA0|nr:acyltransferase [Bifidobacterium simiarum]MBT1166992.1 acyltransferase [Bifidobacterium simiarum]